MGSKTVITKAALALSASVLILSFGHGHASASSAPAVTCTIRMNFWCLVQADAALRMTDSLESRTWSMTDHSRKQVAVIISESKRCDSPGAAHPTRTSDVVVNTQLGVYRVLRFSLTSDGSCIIKIGIPASGSAAQEAERLARTRIYLCQGQDCIAALLRIE
jgi:hypothetical protein